MIPQDVHDWIAERGAGVVQREQPASGGSINDCRRLFTSSGQTFFFKFNSAAPPDMFEAEAAGLAALRVPGAPRVPRVHVVGRDFILLEDLRPNGRCPDFWATYGRQLAALHNKTRKTFGFSMDNYIGSTPQPNPQLSDGHAFFAEQRLLYLGEKVYARGMLARYELQALEHLVGSLPALIPTQPASLLHGDLWSGNALHDYAGQPALIDPAVYYGWAEADLAMTALFGGFSEDFYAGYTEVRPLEPGWRERFPLYNLYHLLNHLLLFGRGYYGQVMQVLSVYA